MILAVDVHYADDHATVAGVLFENWQDAAPAGELVSRVEGVAGYQPGEFYQRELPCILRLIRERGLQPDCIVVDGLVYLDGSSTAGLGRHLYDALLARVPVIGVAKSHYQGLGPQYELQRGASTRPLYVTAAGLDLALAKECILGMHGPHRLPTLLKRVDRLSRAGEG
jgi:deoxyribonuclease V